MLAPTRCRVHPPSAAVVAVVALVVALTAVQGNVASAIATADLTAVAHTRVFFGHQSVGMNVLNAVPGVYADNGVSAPPIEQGRTEPGAKGGFIAHQFIGENGKPLLKLEDFDRTMRGGMGRQVDVALMKFCYVDITTSTDVDALFARFRDTMGALERDFPNVTFIHVTAPLTIVSGGQAENVARERLNALIRGEYASRHSSTSPRSSQRSPTARGSPIATTITGTSRCMTGTPPTWATSTRLVPRSLRQPFSTL